MAFAHVYASKHPARQSRIAIYYLIYLSIYGIFPSTNVSIYLGACIDRPEICSVTKARTRGRKEHQFVLSKRVPWTNKTLVLKRPVLEHPVANLGLE